MKLPTFSFSFFKKPTKKKRIITTFGKRGSSASSSSRKTRRSSSNRKSRKRSITYYAPSKSKFYPTEHFPSMQRTAGQSTAVATIPLTHQSYPSEEGHAVSTDIDAKLNSYLSTTGTLRSHTAKQTYLCDNDYGDIILHQPPAWYMQSKPHQVDYHNETITNLRGSNIKSVPSKLYSNAPIDSNGNLLYDDNRLNNSYGRATYAKECVQGVSFPSTTVNTIPFNESNIKYNTSEVHKQSQRNLLPSSVTTAYNNTAFSSVNTSTNAKYLPNNINNLCAAYQSNAHQLPINAQRLSSPIFNATIPLKKKSDRHRRRKVSSMN